jgi:hypothetical protein
MPGRGGSRRWAGIKSHKGLRPMVGRGPSRGFLRIEKGSAGLSDTKAARVSPPRSTATRGTGQSESPGGDARAASAAPRRLRPGRRATTSSVARTSCGPAARRMRKSARQASTAKPSAASTPAIQRPCLEPRIQALADPAKRAAVTAACSTFFA